MDGTGRVERGEFYSLYDAVPGLAPSGSPDAYRKHAAVEGEGLGEGELAAFLVDSQPPGLVSLAEFESRSQITYHLIIGAIK